MNNRVVVKVSFFDPARDKCLGDDDPPDFVIDTAAGCSVQPYGTQRIWHRELKVLSAISELLRSMRDSFPPDRCLRGHNP